MELKKSDKANLDKFGNIFVLFGFLLMSGLSYILINLRNTTITEHIPQEEIVYESTDEIYEFIDIPEEELPEPPEVEIEVEVEVPPPPVQEIIKIEEVQDDKVIEKVDAPDMDPEEIPPPPTPPISKPSTGKPTPPKPIASKPGKGDIKQVKDEFNYKSVSQKPIFPGCEGKAGKELDMCNSKIAQKELLRKLEYPEDAIDDERSGTAFIKFIIDKNGEIKGAKVLRTSKHEDLDKAALTGVNRMFTGKKKRIVPGKTESGQAVKVIYQVPVKFRLE